MHSLRKRLNVQEESGFTLIELLVVLIIIGVLLAIAVPSYLGFKDRAQRTSAQANVASAVPDAEAFYSDNGTYAGMNLAALKAIDSGVANFAAPSGAIFGNATNYCLSFAVGTHIAKVLGPGGTVNVDVAAQCTSATG